MMLQQSSNSLIQFSQQQKHQIYDVWMRIQELKQVSDESGIEQTPFICVTQQQNSHSTEKRERLLEWNQQANLLQKKQVGQVLMSNLQNIVSFKRIGNLNYQTMHTDVNRQKTHANQTQKLKNKNLKLFQDNKKLFQQCLKLRKTIIDKDQAINMLVSKQSKKFDKSFNSSIIPHTTRQIANITQLKLHNQQYKQIIKIQYQKIVRIEQELFKLKQQAKQFSKSFIQSSQNLQKCMDIIRLLKNDKKQLLSQIQTLKANLKVEYNPRNSSSPSNSTASSRKQYQNRLISNMKMIHDAEVRQLKTQLEFQNRQLQQFKTLLEKYKIRCFYSFANFQS